MPIWLRKFTFHKLKEHYEEKTSSSKNDLSSQTQQIKEGKVQLPDHFKGKLDRKAPKY